jgi:hypothetical protein
MSTEKAIEENHVAHVGRFTRIFPYDNFTHQVR